jgi:predicted P-loop ATPase
MVILEGIQGTGKSTLLRNLCPNEDWFSDGMRLDLQGKEIIEHTAGKWIIEIAELTGRNKAEVNQLKAMLSRQSDGPVRLAYAKTASERPRHFIFIGTVNDTQYITDPTGARRFWPVKTTTLDFQGIATVRDQLWAEANVREKKGESIRLKESLWSVAEKHQEERFEVDPWEDNIREIIAQTLDIRQGGLYISSDALMDAIGIEVARRTKSDSRRIGDIMQRLKFHSTTMRTDSGGVARGYVRRGHKDGDKLWDV